MIYVVHAHGGCGEPHQPTRDQGAPAKIWALTCGQCEPSAREIRCGRTTVAEIPETHDEQAEREDYERRGANDIQTMMALGPDPHDRRRGSRTVARMIDGSKPHIPSQVKVLCPPYGHANPPGMKFCGECAAPMRDAAPAGAIRPPGPRRILRTCTRRSSARCAGSTASMTRGRARR